MDIAIVTGASAGLGWEFARQIDKEYHVDSIWLIARREERLKELAEQLETATKILPLDLTLSESLEQIEQEISDYNAHIHLLVNNAGFGKKGLFQEIDREKQLNMIDLNIRALVELTHITLPHMNAGDQIIQVASSAGFLPMGRFAVYAASKAFVQNFSIALAAELKPRKIWVTAVCPGPVDTEFQAVAYEKPGSRNSSAPSAKVVVEKALRDSAAGKTLSVYGSSIKLVHLLSRFFPRKFLAKMGMMRK